MMQAKEQSMNTPDNPGASGDVGKDPVRWAENNRHLSILAQAVYQGWELPEEASRRLPADLQAIVDDPNTSSRDRIRALECLAALRKDRIDAALQLDRIRRLDAGNATERIEVAKVVTDEQLAAVARVLAASALPAPCPEPSLKPKRKRK